MEHDQSTLHKYYYYLFNKNNNHFLKRTFQLVISVSAFSLFLCYSTGFSLFPHSFNVYFSTFLFSFSTHTFERKYMFLICNGILAFLIKFSVSTSSSSSSSLPTSVFVNGGDGFSAASSEFSQMKELPALLDEDVTIIPVTSTTCEEEKQEDQLKRRCESEVFKAESADDDQEAEELTYQSVVIEEEGEGDDNDDTEEAEAEAVPEGAGGSGNEDIPSTDELNKKIEEFIRKMKEEIRIEAQQQLITV